MKVYLPLLVVLLCLHVKSLFSQEISLTSKDSITDTAWKVGLGYTIIDDSSTPIGQDLFNIKETWNALTYPTRISLGRSFSNGFGLELSGSYNRYTAGKLVDGAINTIPRNYYALDALFSYDVNRIIGDTNWFDPYVQAGGGYSSIGAIGRSTFNAGFGFNIWISEHVGVNLNTMGKWGLPKGSTRQLQHSAGIVYQWNEVGRLSKKGLEKKVLLAALDEETQQMQDSIAIANLEAQKARLQLEKSEKEQQETNRLAALDNERLLENNRKAAIEEDLKAIGHTYFDLNSSYLSAESKLRLDRVALLLQQHPTVQLRVTSHTDARGKDNYNQWLSERRVKRTIDYLELKGVSAERLIGKAYGEKELTNECDNVTVCTEERHMANRRSEFEIVKF